MKKEKDIKHDNFVTTNLQRKILELGTQGNSVSAISKILEMDEYKVEILFKIISRKSEASDTKPLVIIAFENGFLN